MPNRWSPGCGCCGCDGCNGTCTDIEYASMDIAFSGVYGSTFWPCGDMSHSHVIGDTLGNELTSIDGLCQYIKNYDLGACEFEWATCPVGCSPVTSRILGNVRTRIIGRNFGTGDPCEKLAVEITAEFLFGGGVPCYVVTPVQGIWYKELSDLTCEELLSPITIPLLSKVDGCNLDADDAGTVTWNLNV